MQTPMQHNIARACDAADAFEQLATYTGGDYDYIAALFERIAPILADSELLAETLREFK